MSVTATTTITNKFQIHIPVAIRKAMGLDKPGKAEVIATTEGILIKPQKTTSLMELAGKFKGLKPVTPIDLDNVRDYIDYSDL